MKAKFDRSWLPGLAGGVVSVVAAGALAWFGLSSLGEKQAEAEALAERMGNPALASLLTSPDGAAKASREAGEIQKLVEKLKKDEGAVMNLWSKGTGEATGEGQDWSKDPSKWKDRLIEIQGGLQKKATAARVQLAPDFYLGLEAFRQKSPSPEEVPALALRLAVAQRLVERLLQARTVIEQYPTGCELRTLVSSETPEDKKEGDPVPPVAKNKPAAAGPERKTFVLEISSSPEVLYEFIRLLARDDWLFVVKNMVMINSNQLFPLRSEIAKEFSKAATAGEGGEGGGPKEKKLLKILSGGESLLTTIELDFVAWRNPKPAGSPVSSRPNPAP